MTVMARILRAIAGSLIGLCITANTAAGQTLRVSGDHFTVDGRGKFLVFLSYFHGLDRPSATLVDDFGWLVSKGIDGVRIWPNVSQPRLMDEHGQLNSSALAKLRFLVGEAARRGMVVDVTFTKEHVVGDFTMSEYEQAIAATARALEGTENVLFDLQNEWNCWYGLDGMTIDALSSIRAAVKLANPTLIVTASNSCHPYPGAGTTAFDVLAYHGPRDRSGYWARNTDDLLRDLESAVAETPRRAVPVYLQEPNRFRYAFDTFTYYDSNPSNYLLSVRNAKMEGAAAWAFHTAASFDLSSTIALSSLLLPGERAVLDNLATTLSAQATWGIHAPTDPGAPTPPTGFRVVNP